MKEQTPVSELTHRDLVYEALILAMGSVQITIHKDSRFLALYGELVSRLDNGEELCDKCREKVKTSELVAK